MHTLEGNHRFNLNHFLHSRMSKIYIFQAVFTFIKSMIGVFIPIYLYKLGYSIISIILYNIGLSLVMLIFMPITVKIINKIGFKYTLLLSILIYFFHLVSLNFISGIYSIYFFHFSWFTFGIYIAIFWPTMHSEFAVNLSNKKTSSELGTVKIIMIIFSSFAPLIGGIFLGVYSYFYLLIFSSIFMIFGLIPLLLAEDIKLKYFDFNYIDYLKLIKNSNYNFSKLAFASEGIEHVLILLLWPIIIFFILNENYVNFGFLFTIISIITVLFILYFKKYIDSHDKNFILKISTRFLSFSWFLKSLILFFNILIFYFIESMSRIILSVFELSYLSIFYKNAKKVGYMNYVILRELYIHIIRILFLILIILYLFLFGESLVALISILFVGVFLSLGLSNLKEE